MTKQFPLPQVLMTNALISWGWSFFKLFVLFCFYFTAGTKKETYLKEDLQLKSHHFFCTAILVTPHLREK